jgi:outer membrane protein assembly factor BamB
MHPFHRLTAACFLLLVMHSAGEPAAALADDWPQWMGPTRDGEYRETGLLERFPEEGPKVLWRQPVAGGYAGPAVARGKVVVTDFVRSEGDSFNDPGQRAELQGRERVLCFDQKTGEPLWEHSYECRYAISYPVGPRCTPTISGDEVITLGSEGDLLCLDLNDGSVRWAVNFKTDLGAETPLWGFSAHPLIDGDQVICMVGGSGQTVVSFDRSTGKVLWRSRDASAAGYCPPSIIEAGGTRQLIVWHAEAVESLNPTNGELYWSVPLEPMYEMAIARPQRDGDLLYVSGIGSKSVLLKLGVGRPTVEELWAGGPKNSLYSGNATPLFVDGTIYGADCQVGSFIAVDAKDGSRLWTSFVPTRQGETRRVSHGTAFATRLAGSDRYLLFSELGDLILARLTPQGYDEISRAHVIEPTQEAFGRDVIWSHPAYADRTAYIRNDEELIAVSLASSQVERKNP